MTFFLHQYLKGPLSRRYMLLCIAFVFGVTTVFADAEAKKTSVRDLRAKLFENYDKTIRPVVNQRTVTPVHVSMSPIALTEMDEEKQIMELDSWILMKWKDEYLVWDPQEFDGITSFNIPSSEVWRPDITVYTGSPAKKIVIEVYTNVIINYTGDVLWVPPVTIRSRCPQEVYSYQQDSQITCVVKLGSWTHHEYRVDLQTSHGGVRMEDFINNNPNWDLLSVNTERLSKYYSCCKEPYPVVNFKFALRRRSTGRGSRKCATGGHQTTRSHYHSNSKCSCDTGHDGCA